MGRNTTTFLRYRKAYASVTIKANYPLLVNRSVINSETIFRVKFNSTLSFVRACADAGNYTVLCSDKIRVVRGNVTEEFRLNATLTFSEDAVVSTEGATLYVLEFRNVVVPVSVNGSLYSGDFELRVPPNSTIVAEAHGGDDRGCFSFNDTHLICPVNWTTPTGVYPFGRYMVYRAVRGGVLRLNALLLPREHRVIEGEVYVNGRLAPAKLIPGDRYMIIPFIGNYEYLGNATWRLWGDQALFYLQIPTNWTWVTVRVLKVKAKPFMGGYMSQDVCVVVRNDEVYFSKGFPLPHEGSATIIFEKKLIDPSDLTVSWQRPPGVCYGCGNAVAGYGPGSRTFEGVEPYWLEVNVYGEVVVQVEVEV
ncbi:hypothetical protein [Infirmifilum sp. NZ]|uniref:hypothetical protein n=1 Tax=Infirmifilum sp. NZ TaxID=2926850 RepID=UPI002798CA98|nr:hypothetical protein [Infirmifilum sp. NZ]UNQ72706.1 hypothetical protein MOV14_06190 [Infirmifilum sp. NZ]